MRRVRLEVTMAEDPCPELVAGIADSFRRMEDLEPECTRDDGRTTVAVVAPIRMLPSKHADENEVIVCERLLLFATPFMVAGIHVSRVRGEWTDVSGKREVKMNDR